MEYPLNYKLPDHIVKKLQPPMCDLLKLPEPTKLDLCSIFGGAKIQGIVDVTKAIPDDCSLLFSILLQLPPIMISLGCFIKLLGVAGPLIKFVEAVPKLQPQKILEAVPELVEALGEVVKCFASLALGLPAFIRDLLLLIAKLLKCVAQMVLSLAKLIGGLEISIKTAEAAGNKELLKQLECAKGNAEAQAKAAQGSLDVVQLLMTLAEPLFKLANVEMPSIPAVASAEDVASMEEAANTMLSIASSIETIAKALPTC
ncbi:MAG: hypothetical protein WKG01_09970 [Kofleriaceae bacterium]